MSSGFMGKIRNFFTVEDEIGEDEEVILPPEKSKWKGKLVGLASSRHNAIIVMEPASVKEAQELAEHLKNRSAVILNLQNLDKDTATRILDFASGMTYALSGNIQKISEYIFLFAPPAIPIILPPKKVGVVKETGQLFIK
jgi:cell division inhibitor SepF